MNPFLYLQEAGELSKYPCQQSKQSCLLKRLSLLAWWSTGNSQYFIMHTSSDIMCTNTLHSATLRQLDLLTSALYTVLKATVVAKLNYALQPGEVSPAPIIENFWWLYSIIRPAWLLRCVVSDLHGDLCTVWWEAVNRMLFRGSNCTFDHIFWSYLLSNSTVIFVWL